MSLFVPEELVASARDGDRASLERLLEIVWPHAFRIARSIVRDDDAAEDIAQEACAIVYRTIASVRSAEAFRAWFYRIVTREAVAFARRAQIVNAQPAEPPSSGAHEARLDVHDALWRLPMHMRTALILRYYAELTSKEIGSVLGIPSGTVRFRLALARRRMYDLLRDPRDRNARATKGMVV